MAKAEKINLPAPDTKGKISLEEAISKRRSQRGFLEKGLSWGEAGQLLWSAQGITAKKEGRALRASPSAGALYPMEIYILTKEGVFHYLPQEHALEAGLKKDLRKSLADAAWGQGCVAQAPLDIVICMVLSRLAQKYGERSLRYAHIEAGHIAQNIHLQAAALGLGSVPVGAFNDEEVKRVLSLPSECAPLYIIPVGYLKK